MITKITERISENTVWTSAHGVCTKIKDMDDSYLANLRDYLNQRHGAYSWSCDAKLIKVIDKLAKKRKLKKEFFQRAQIPYKNPRGKWEIWDFKRFCPMEISK